MWKVAEGMPPWPVLIATLLGGALAAAGSNSINQALDSDIDARMRRTKNRPVPSNQIGGKAAIGIGVLCIGFAVILMGLFSNWASALLTLIAAAYYVFLYTLMMKRKSWNNIVIGGAAGAFPPLIGSVAVIGQVEIQGLYMFAIVFFWTPPHFWALSLLLKEDYAEARIPMLSVVAGEKNTGIQINLYIILIVLLTWLPLIGGYAGLVYCVSISILGLEWLRRSIPLIHTTTRETILKSYKFSILYLYLTFLVLAIDASVI
jgi:protoheme IX farnesyltransferase